MGAKYAAALLLLTGLCQVTSAQPRSACSSCVRSFTTLHSRIGSIVSDEHTLKARSEACVSLPLVQQEMCQAALKAALPAIVARTQYPLQACGDLEICNKTEAVLLAASSNANDLNCELCDYVMATIKEQLEDPETEADLLAQASQICEGLPGDARTQCLQYIAEYGRQLFDWVHKENPEDMCVQAGFCLASSHLQPLSPPLKAVATRLFTIQDDDQCNTCQMVIVEASSVLSDPKTQKEILEYIKQNCKDFQTFADQCATYIDLYGPLVLNMARQYLKPELCTQLGFCSAGDAQASIMVS